MLMSSEIQKSESGLRWVEVHRNPPQSTLYFMFWLSGLCTTLNSFFFASRVINFKCFLIFFNIFDGKIKLLCFSKGKMPYLTIFGLFVEIWTVCSLEEAHGNGKS